MNFTPAIDISKNEEFYTNLFKLVDSYIISEPDWLAQLTNSLALLNEMLPQVNWIGVYLLKDKDLVLGPFQGKMACNRIPLEKGVCGKSATELKTMNIDNVGKIENYISCHKETFSELVIPIFYPNKKQELEHLIGVLDIDSPVFARFTEIDQKGLEKIAQLLGDKINWPEPSILRK
ncbi:GAF domain-containing protein [Pigmentibacter sp. JX0631]|uniref:GAF domain-containing protein n=1 Tax=Pigmentibacter sp. JX0631 TaxID=2976982 RepID=UPI0024695A24|nr:GAF domain-containing protein [Pigmentibacter sp. JX0631]WGL59528.1 GAF domain-containing protein [Pigmentibacter sp. JX0631]